MIRAFLSQAKGIAVLDDGGKRIGLIDGRIPNEIRRVSELEAARHISGATDLEAIEVTTSRALHTHLRIRIQREELLRAAIVLIDGEQSKRARELASAFLAEHGSESQFRWIEGVLLSANLPGSADVAGALKLNPPNSDFLAQLPHMQRRVELLLRSWHALPEAVFKNETRSQSFVKVVRNGVFRQLLNANERSSGPLFPALTSYQSSLWGIAEEPKVARQQGNFPALMTTQASSVPRWMWDIKPWQAAWRAARWPEVSLWFASSFAIKLIARIGDDWRGAKGKVRQELALSRLYKAWQVDRYRSDLSPWVDVLFDLENSTPLWRGDPNSQIRNQCRSFSKLDTLGRASNAHIHQILQEFFDLHAARHAATQFAVIECLKDQRLLSETSPTWIMVADDAHRAISANSLFNAFTISKQEPSFRISDFGIHEGAAQNARDQFTQVLGTYALSRILENRGCIIHSLGAFGDRPETLLINPHFRNSIIFAGAEARILYMLDMQLQDDLASGLNREYSGWRSLKDVVIRMGGALRASIGDIRDLRRRVGEAGIAEDVIQVRNDQVRLNPDVTASTGQKSKG